MTVLDVLGTEVGLKKAYNVTRSFLWDFLVYTFRYGEVRGFPYSSDIQQ